MKKVIVIVLAVVLVAMLGATGVFAQENPNASAKATAQLGNLHVFSVAHADDFEIDFDSDGSMFDPIMEQNIKVGGNKDLFIDLALQTGCYTTTEVKSKGMQKDTSLGACQIWVWVRVAGEKVYPRYPIVFDSRIQRLSATLEGYTGNNSAPGSTIGDPEVIELFIGTMSAHSFNFVVEDLDPGMHTVKVYVWATTQAASQEGSATAIATVGLGSMTIEEVRMVKDDDIWDWWL